MEKARNPVEEAGFFIFRHFKKNITASDILFEAIEFSKLFV